MEKLVFSRRPLWLLMFAVLTVLLAWQASRLEPDASFEKMIPQEHPYIQAMMRHIADLGAAGTSIQVVPKGMVTKGLWSSPVAASSRILPSVVPSFLAFASIFENQRLA